jgi:outer membrane protein OmpA-like peptidoglycan-associated protein
MKFKLIWLAFLLTGIAQAQEMEFQVELMNRVGTETNRKGDLVSARVVSPSGFQGSVVEGKITESKSGAKSGGESVLDIDFDILRHNNTVIPINSKIKSVGNSKGQVNVDEDGRVIGRAGESNKRSSGTGGLGRALGGITGGRAARIGAAVDTPASVVLRVSADAPNLRFDPGSKFVLTASSRSGPALASLASSQPAATTASAPATTQPSAATAPQTAAGSGQPNLTAVKADFIPGDKAIFYDDFTDMAGDEPPPHWKVRGGTAELRTGEGGRQLTMTALQMTMVPNLTGLPKNFTMEANVAYKGHGAVATWRFHDKKGLEAMQVRAAVNYTNYSLSIRSGGETLSNQQIPMDWSQPVKQALWVQNGRVRFYVNGQRVMDVNQINLPELGEIQVFVEGPGSNDRTGYVGFQFVRFAESIPDFSQIISSSGRYVTHGILFDTDSDKIKPESAPVIKQIASGLEKNPNLKLLIEGHTDSVGDAAHNMDLSKRRAEAVRSVLIGQFNVDASRLSATGLGSTKPVDSNDTPQGRAQNRRVELVKQ